MNGIVEVDGVKGESTTDQKEDKAKDGDIYLLPDTFFFPFFPFHILVMFSVWSGGIDTSLMF